MRSLLFVLLLAVGTCCVLAAAPQFKKAPHSSSVPPQFHVVDRSKPNGENRTPLSPRVLKSSEKAQ